jgi:hypothetical protein
VWPDLRDQLAVEQAQLRQLFDIHRPLLEKCRSGEPGGIELSALGAFLHSLYTGMENLFRRVVIELGGSLPRGEAWHRRLLQEMMEPTSERLPLLSTELGDQLKPYLQFRHVFRQAYSFQLQWEKMAPLVLNSELLFTRICAEIAAFSTKMNEKSGQ